MNIRSIGIDLGKTTFHLGALGALGERGEILLRKKLSRKELLSFSANLERSLIYAGRTALLLDGRYNNLEYGSYAPDAPQVFIDDQKFASLWTQPTRYYLLTYGTDMPRWAALVGQANLYLVAENAGNYLLTNHPLL